MQAETRKRYGIGIRAQMKTDCVVSVKGLVMLSCKPSVPGTGWSAARLLGILAINARRLDNQTMSLDNPANAWTHGHGESHQSSSRAIVSRIISRPPFVFVA